MVFAVKLMGKLQDGTVFLKKGHDEDELFEFKTEEGTDDILSYLGSGLLSLYCLFYCICLLK